ncbi:MAG: histidine kinase dimerization/phospho-acceptor domain-containing protein, partial [Myxococcota bacterium]
MAPGRSDPDEPVSRAERRAARRAERTLRKAARRARRSAEHAGRGDGRDAVYESIDPAARADRRLLRRARRRAHRRLGFVTHFGTYAATLALLLVATRSVRLVVFVGLAWGIGVFCHYLWALVAPGLRDHWIEREVGARSARDVASERRQVETRSRRSMEDLSASIAHEIRNPITAAKSLVQQMGEDPASQENLEYASLALSELDRVERSISHLLRYAREEEPRFEPVELRALARSAVEGLRDRAASAGVPIELDFDGPLAMRGDPEKLRRVLENLIVNAIDAMVGAGTPAPRIRISG